MENDQMSLTPASGAGLGKVLFEALLRDPEFLPTMVAAAMGGLTACFPKRWDKHADDWGEGEPDHKTRVQTFLALWAQAEGEPVKRMIHQHISAGGNIDALAALQDSDATREALRRLIDKADNAKRKQKRLHPTVDAQETPADGPVGEF